MKSKIFDVILSFLNLSIKEIPIINDYFLTKKINYSKPFFLKIEQDIIKNINKDFNRNILKSKLKVIFSYKISKIIKKYNPYYYKNLIEKIY